jgi:hypothetical protein
MAGVIATIPKFQFSANGVPMVGGTLETYIAGSTTPATTWQDSALTIANTNPISLDARGECVLWLDPAVVYKFVLKNAQGVIQWTQDNISNPAALANSLRADLAASSGASLVGFLQAGAGAVATTVQSKLRECVSVKDFGAVGDWSTTTHTGTDDTAAIQAALNSGSAVYLPPGKYKISTALTIPAGVSVQGASWALSGVFAYGCDAFVLAAGTNNVTIEKLTISSYDVGGAIDPKTNTGISSAGASGNTNAWVTTRDVYMRGWLYCIDWKYTWNSVIDNVSTSFCQNAVRLFGQSVNNAISNSRLGANGGNASILTEKDVAIKGEGLMVTGCLLAEGAYGVYSDGFLSLSLSSCVIDLIQDKAFNLTNCPAFTLSSSWVYAENFGVNFNTLGVSVDQGASITGCYITVAAASGRAVHFGGNNKGLSITGGALTCGTSGRLVYSDGNGVSVVGVNGVNTGDNPSILFAGLDCVASANTGSMAVQWAVGVQSQGGVAVATLSFNGVTGAALFANGCSISRTDVGAYSVTFTYPLVSASYLPMVTLDRGGNGAMGYAIVSQSTTGFSFTVTNAAGTPNDVTGGWIAVFN